MLALARPAGGRVVVACPKCEVKYAVDPAGAVVREREDEFASLPPAVRVPYIPPRAKGFRATPPPPPPAAVAAPQPGRVHHRVRPATRRPDNTVKIVKAIVGISVAMGCAAIMVGAVVFAFRRYGGAGLTDRASSVIGGVSIGGVFGDSPESVGDDLVAEAKQLSQTLKRFREDLPEDRDAARRAIDSNLNRLRDRKDNALALVVRAAKTGPYLDDKAFESLGQQVRDIQHGNDPRDREIGSVLGVDASMEFMNLTIDTAKAFAAAEKLLQPPTASQPRHRELFRDAAKIDGSLRAEVMERYPDENVYELTPQQVVFLEPQLSKATEAYRRLSKQYAETISTGGQVYEASEYKFDFLRYHFPIEIIYRDSARQSTVVRDFLAARTAVLGPRPGF